ncbi:MAG: hypothetical protein KL840_08360 [Aquamicrobium sp.]|nr:hypothetical protein [Aquamicrobium sp.]
MKSSILMIIGAIVVGATFVGWWSLNAFACGMNSTGCTGFSLAWDDWEALQYFVPTFVIGAVVFIVGLWKTVSRSTRS